MIDLHVHTIYSDGEYDPLQVLRMCKERGITTVAITDHNSLEGSRQAVSKNPYKDITVISGIELGALYSIKGANLHILGYNIALNNKQINEVSQAIMRDNIMRIKSCVDLLKKYYGISFDEADVEQIFMSVGNIGRPDIAKLCVRYGYSSNVQDAFKRYLNPVDDEVAKRSTELTDKECIEYIVNAGGIACLAHPIELKKDIQELKKYISKLKSYGLGAVEVYQSKHTPQYSKELLSIVNEYELLYSVGSDYHGPVVTPDIELGYGKNNNLNMNNATILSKILEKKHERKSPTLC